MDEPLRLLVFTDLDGTLLDHGSYSYAPAMPALSRLKRLSVPLVLASSKTAAEISVLHAELGLGDAPGIVENGAGLYRPGLAAADHDDYDRLRAALDGLPAQLRAQYVGFGDMSVGEVADVTGLPAASAELAKARQFSEPGQWLGDEAGQADFLAALEEQGIKARRGGRFLTLSFGATKADRMSEITAERGADITIALGDAPNDVEMLQTATHGVIIKNDHGAALPALPGEATGHIHRTDAPGPTGWNRAVNHLLDELTKGAFDG